MATRQNYSKTGTLSKGVNSGEMVRNEHLQFSKGILGEFGDLGYG